MKMCSLGSIDPLNREAWGLSARHSSHLLPTPVPGTPAAVEKLEDLKVLRRSPDLLNNVKIGQG